MIKYEDDIVKTQKKHSDEGLEIKTKADLTFNE